MLDNDSPQAPSTATTCSSAVVTVADCAAASGATDEDTLAKPARQRGKKAPTGCRTLVYRFGLLPPTFNAERVRDQLRKAHQHRNVLTEIECGRRDAIRAAQAEHGDMAKLTDALRGAKEAEDAIRTRIKTARAEMRGRAETAEDKAELTQAREARKAAAKALAAYRAEERKRGGFKADEKVINGRANELGKSARQYSGNHWGTYLLTEAAAEKAREAPLYDYDEPNDPSFKRFRGEGTLGVQIQWGKTSKGIYGADLLRGEDTRARLVQVPALSRKGEPLTGKRSKMRYELWLRIGSEGPGNRIPVWAKFPCVMHRTIPENARITWVAVSVRRIGPREEWSCKITVEQPIVSAPPTEKGKGVVVHLGFLQVGKDLRVATTMDEAGNVEQVVIHASDAEGGVVVELDGGARGVLSGLRVADNLRSVRDKNFNTVLPAIVAWLEEHDMPEWARARTVRRGTALPSKAQALAYLSGWRSPARLASFIRCWGDNRIDGDAAIFAEASSWCAQDRHLWQWESDQRESAQRRRTDVYRRFAAALAERYGKIVVDGQDLTTMARRPRVGETEDVNIAAARHNRTNAACSSLRMAIENAAKARGRECVRLDMAGASTTCPKCGERDKAHVDRKEHRHTCAVCGFSRDLDMVARLNMLRAVGLDEAVNGIITRQEQAAAKLRSGGK